MKRRIQITLTEEEYAALDVLAILGGHRRASGLAGSTVRLLAAEAAETAEVQEILKLLAEHKPAQEERHLRLVPPA